MLTDKQLRDRAEKMAFAEYFCNVDEPDWPDDPWRLLNNDTFYSDDDRFCLLVWEPFEDLTVRDVYELVENASDSYFHHLKWARDNAA